MYLLNFLGNMVFGISKEFSWTTTLWESLFFFIFVFLLQNYRKNKHVPSICWHMF
ncbi:hypothetical protein B1P84_07440 [Enterococcus faecium]|nr:hypothetical protein B1P84_07440 [Enterococcus faecium]